jgi:hypothetical protein
MSLPRAFHRPWAYLTVPALAACGVFAVAVLQGLAILPVASRLERRGEFTVRYDTYDAFGHRGTRRTLYYQGGGKRRHLIARRVGAFIPNPYAPSSLLYERCPEEGSAECGIHYFDSRRRRQWRVSEERVLNQGFGEPVAWSADGRFVVLTSEDALRVANLETATTTDMSAALALQQGRRRPRFSQWSYDQRKIAVLVGEYMDRTPPFARIAEDLVVIDVYDRSVVYVATSQPRGWDRTRVGWKLPAGNVMWAPPDQQGPKGTIYRKRAVELPNGMQVQVP